MVQVQEKIKNQKDIKRNSKKKSLFRKSIPKNREERNEQALIELRSRLEDLTDIVVKQSGMITDLKTELCTKIERLKCFEDQVTPKSSYQIQYLTSKMKMSSNNDLDDISVEELKRIESDKYKTPPPGEKWNSPQVSKRVEEIKKNKDEKDLDYILSMNTDELFKNTSPTMKGNFGSVSDFRSSLPKTEEEPKPENESNQKPKLNILHMSPIPKPNLNSAPMEENDTNLHPSSARSKRSKNSK